MELFLLRSVSLVERRVGSPKSGNDNTNSTECKSLLIIPVTFIVQRLSMRQLVDVSLVW